MLGRFRWAVLRGRGGVRTPAFQEGLVALSVLSVWYLGFSMLGGQTTELIGTHWPIVVVAFAAATVANATAVGGGFVFFPLFSFCYGITGTASLKLALATQAFGMTSGALSWPARSIHRPAAIVACLGGGLGMTVGTYRWIPPGAWVDAAFGAVSTVLGAALLLQLTLARHTRGRSAAPVGAMQYAVFFGVCVAGGLVNAWVSIGAGEAVALWLFFRWRVDIAQAVATGVVALAFCSVLGLIFHAALGGIPWHYLAFTVPGVILGGRTGARLGTWLSNTPAAPAASRRPTAGAYRLKALIAAVILADGLVVLFHGA